MALVETGLRSLAPETTAVVRKYDLQRPRGQVVAADTVVVGLPGPDKPFVQVPFVHRSSSDLRTAEHHMIAGNIETVPGNYGGAKLTQGVDGTNQGAPGHNQFWMVRVLD
ncbi:MAG: hypothetical protein ABSA91_14645 [Acidimicrobiales bacterium]